MRRFSGTMKWAVALAACTLIAACVALRVQAPKEKGRGLIFRHEVHLAEEMACGDCHDFSAGEPAIPNHDVCGVCHDIPEDEPTPEVCSPCHARADYSVTAWSSRMSKERKFAHAPHLDAEVACASCHTNADATGLPSEPLKPMCLDCHKKTRPELTACSVCHTELDVNVTPQYRKGQRLTHDAPQVWARVHGRESLVDPVFCAQCHDEESSCEECHRTTKPANHTVAWRRRPHGLQATWDRTKCAVCHEEDFCLKCHQNTKPASHRGGFGYPRNTHCAQCHYPATAAGCTVCHESIPHEGALPSPHLLGIYPPNCRLCHPGGLPNRAPHLTNSTVPCIVCHR